MERNPGCPLLYWLMVESIEGVSCEEMVNCWCILGYGIDENCTDSV